VMKTRDMMKRSAGTALSMITCASPSSPRHLTDLLPLPRSQMSEYWVSNKKYYCTYCKIYIADDAPSRQQHENGLRHKGNKERFVRGLYKTSEKRKHDLEEEKREMMRIDQVSQLFRPNFERLSNGHTGCSSRIRPGCWIRPR
jgi:hypothetical protein